MHQWRVMKSNEDNTEYLYRKYLLEIINKRLKKAKKELFYEEKFNNLKIDPSKMIKQSEDTIKKLKRWSKKQRGCIKI